jgi:hypothetical protein
MTPLVSTEWLAANLENPDLVVCDCSFYLPTDPRHATKLFTEARIPGARFFDIDAIKDTTSDLPHMLPTPKDFAEMVGALGISNRSTVVFYDQLGLFSAARGWWMMRVFGHDEAAVLDGGLPKWQAENRPLETAEPVLPSPNWCETTARCRPSWRTVRPSSWTPARLAASPEPRPNPGRVYAAGTCRARTMFRSTSCWRRTAPCSRRTRCEHGSRPRVRTAAALSSPAAALPP